METTKTLSRELGADIALRRTAVKAKQEAERLDAPYVICSTPSKCETLSKKQADKQTQK